MDKINKFLATKPTKNQRTIIHKNQEITITKTDVHKIKKYKQNRCLDKDVVLYQPYSTKYSKETRIEPLKPKKHKDYMQYRYMLFVKRAKKYKRHVSRDINEIIDVWKDEETLEGEHKIESFVSEKNKIQGYMDTKEFRKQDLQEYIEELKKHWYTEIKRKKYKIEDLLPKIVDKSKFDEHAKDIAKKYEYNKPVNNFYIDENNYCMAVAHDDCVTVNDLRNNREYFRFDYKENVNAAILSTTKLFVIFCKKIEIIELNYKTETKIEVSDTTQNNDVSWNEHKKEKTQNFFATENDKTVITHKNRIKDYSYNVKENFLALITGKIIILHDVTNKKSYQPVKLKTELPLKIELNKKCDSLLIATTNNFYIYNFKQKQITCRIESTVTYAHTFSYSKNFVVIGDKENRLVIVNDNKVVRVMEQNKKIQEIVYHSKLNYFCVVFKNEIISFHSKMENNFECSIIAKYTGTYKNVKFHDTLHWIYAIRNNEIVIFT